MAVSYAPRRGEIIELHPINGYRPKHLLRLGKMTEVAGEPESAETSDPDTSDYCASSEDSERSLNPPKISLPRNRADSRTDHSLFTRASSPYAYKGKGKRALYKKPKIITGRSVGFTDENRTRSSLFIPPIAGKVPVRDIPIYIPAPAEPGQSTYLEHRPQLGRRQSPLQRFGTYANHSVEICAGHDQPSKPRQGALEHLRLSFSELNIPGRLRQLTRGKRSGPFSDSEDKSVYKASETDVYCQFCSRAEEEDPLAHVHAHISSLPVPADYIRRTTTVTVMSEPRPQDANSDRWAPHQNAQALRALEIDSDDI